MNDIQKRCAILNQKEIGKITELLDLVFDLFIERAEETSPVYEVKQILSIRKKIEKVVRLDHNMLYSANEKVKFSYYYYWANCYILV